MKTSIILGIVLLGVILVAIVLTMGYMTPPAQVTTTDLSTLDSIPEAPSDGLDIEIPEFEEEENVDLGSK